MLFHFYPLPSLFTRNNNTYSCYHLVPSDFGRGKGASGHKRVHASSLKVIVNLKDNALSLLMTPGSLFQGLITFGEKTGSSFGSGLGLNSFSVRPLVCDCVCGSEFEVFIPPTFLNYLGILTLPL